MIIVFQLTSPLDLAADILEDIFPLVTLSNNEVDVVESKNGARHGTSM